MKIIIIINMYAKHILMKNDAIIIINPFIGIAIVSFIVLRHV